MHVDFHTGSISTTVSQGKGVMESRLICEPMRGGKVCWFCVEADSGALGSGFGCCRLCGCGSWGGLWDVQTEYEQCCCCWWWWWWWWIIYDRFLLPSRFLKLDGLIFISANSIECSWPFQWNQFTPWRGGIGQMMLVKVELKMGRRLAMFLSQSDKNGAV